MLELEFVFLWKKYDIRISLLIYLFIYSFRSSRHSSIYIFIYSYWFVYSFIYSFIYYLFISFLGSIKSTSNNCNIILKKSPEERGMFLAKFAPLSFEHQHYWVNLLLLSSEGINNLYHQASPTLPSSGNKYTKKWGILLKQCLWLQIRWPYWEYIYIYIYKRKLGKRLIQ